MNPSTSIWHGKKGLKRVYGDGKKLETLYVTKVDMKKKTITLDSKPAMKIKQVDWFGFDHKKVIAKFEGDLTFCAEFCVRGEYDPVAVYKANKPNTKKGHKKYVLLHRDYGGDMASIRGMTAQEMQKERYQNAVLCKNCNTILYSINRHHYHGCGCKQDIHVDGGKDYLKISGHPDFYKVVKLDLITGKLKK